MEMPDEKIIADYLRGDEQSFKLLVQRYLKPIYNFSHKYAGNAQDAEDLTQEVFVKVWKNIKKFDRNKNFKNWIFNIARNTAIDFLRKRKNKILTFSDFENAGGDNLIIETLADSAPLPLENLARQNLAEELDKALEKLPPKYRRVLSLHYYGQLTFKEIAKSLAQSLNTVKSQQRRAVMALKKIFVSK